MVQLQSMSAECVVFVQKQLRALLFPLLFVAVLALSYAAPAVGIYRYDFLFVVTLMIQAGLVYFRYESKDEARAIAIFHVIGLCLELFKTHPSVGSWSYPEPGYLKVGTVPLFSGFMYAAVGSYIMACWKLYGVTLKHAPSYALSLILSALIYLNFFTNHFMYDYRLWLFGGVVALYYRTKIVCTIRSHAYTIPVLLVFLWTGCAVWVAENIATYYGAWQYPGQAAGWQMVGLHKITSWVLLVIISFMIVAYLKHYKGERQIR